MGSLRFELRSQAISAPFLGQPYFQDKMSRSLNPTKLDYEPCSKDFCIINLKVKALFLPIAKNFVVRFVVKEVEDKICYLNFSRTKRVNHSPVT